MSDENDSQAADQLLPLVYDELRKLAAAKLAHEQPGQTLNTTGLVHEAYLRLTGQSESGKSPAVKGQFANRRYFFAAAAEAMRRILIERARHRQTIKHGGGRHRIPIDDIARVADTPDGLIAIDEVLDRFATQDPQKAELVKLRFFTGMTMPEVAAALDISVATAERWWAYARAWLYDALSESD